MVPGTGCLTHGERNDSPFLEITAFQELIIGTRFLYGNKEGALSAFFVPISDNIHWHAIST
jgi:hypothetical protein